MIVAADNLHALNPVVAAALKDLDPGPLQELARRCEQAGAKILDLNPGFLAPGTKTACPSWWRRCNR